MSIEVSLDTLPDYLRGEGHPDLADMIETAGRDGRKLVTALSWAEMQLDAGEALDVVQAMLRMIEPPVLEASMQEEMSVGQLAERLGVSAPTMHRYVNRPDFPEPSGEIAGARVWRLGDVLAWHRDADLSPGRPRNK